MATVSQLRWWYDFFCWSLCTSLNISERFSFYLQEQKKSEEPQGCCWRLKCCSTPVYCVCSVPEDLSRIVFDTQVSFKHFSATGHDQLCMITLQIGKIARCLDFILGLWFKSSGVLPPIHYGILILKVGRITENLAELKFDLLVLESLKSVFIVGLSVWVFF